jgi:hypothetical protein
MNTTVNLDKMTQEEKTLMVYNYIKYNIHAKEDDIEYYRNIVKTIFDEFDLSREEAEMIAFEYIRDMKNAMFDRTNCTW